MTTVFQNKIIPNEGDKINFSDLSLSTELQANIKELGFTSLTPIQRYSINFTGKGHDLIGCAQTGSGKTIAFLLPIVNKMLSEGPPDDLGIIFLK
jgi:superfamily II DNA/RNA helicase